MAETALVPAEAELHREAASEALARGDQDAANREYAAELAARADESVETPAGREIALPRVSDDVLSGTLAAYDAYDPQGMAELRRDWPGPEMADNIGYADWICGRYAVPATMGAIRVDADLLRIGAGVGRGVAADLRDGNSIGPITPKSADTERAFLAGLDAAERDALLASVPDFRQALGAAAALIGRYIPGQGDRLPDAASFWVMALPAAEKIARDLRGRAGRATTSSNSEASPMSNLDADELDDQLDDIRSRQAKALERGDSRKANRLFVEEQSIIAARAGNRPIVNGRRTA